jgi:hypothetical protein
VILGDAVRLREAAAVRETDGKVDAVALALPLRERLPVAGFVRDALADAWRLLVRDSDTEPDGSALRDAVALVLPLRETLRERVGEAEPAEEPLRDALALGEPTAV